MVQLKNEGLYLVDGRLTTEAPVGFDVKEAKKKTMAYRILAAHSRNGEKDAEAGALKIKFDAMASHDITYVGIIQTARASGLEKFPIPYVLTNCHNSLCAVGGTINEDDHVFGLSAAKKYGGIFVPAHQAVIHSYMREMQAGCGKMIIGSDSHTRYGALGTMAVGEGGPELVKQLLERPYEINTPDVICIYLDGKVKPGVGPQDVALAIIKAVFANGFVKNKVMEFVGPGIENLSVDFRNGIDVMTTETTCLSSIWVTDEKVKKYYEIHGRPDDYKKLQPENGAYYDGAVVVDLSKIECMIALPFHPSNAYTVKDFIANAADILRETEKVGEKQYGAKVKAYKLTDKVVDGKVMIDQGVIAGCSGGTFENVCRAAEILKGKSIGSGSFGLSVYPASQPVFMELTRNGNIAELMQSGATIRSAFCGPCFGAGDVPCNNGFSIRHTTRNFPNREGSKPSDGQISWVALMDARSIAATAANGGVLTAATDIETSDAEVPYTFDDYVYKTRVYQGFGKADPTSELKFGPNIADWPKMDALNDNILLVAASVINDEVTTTDELIPSGETSSYRSNPLRLAEFTLSRKDPEYVGRAKAVNEAEKERKAEKASPLFDGIDGAAFDNTSIGSVVLAKRPGDGSAREQAASCQKVLGGQANIAVAYATKRYRSNLINWGMLPFTLADENEDVFNGKIENGDRIFVKGVKNAVENGIEDLTATVYKKDGSSFELGLKLSGLTDTEKDIILSGCLINYYNRK